MGRLGNGKCDSGHVGCESQLGEGHMLAVLPLSSPFVAIPIAFAVAAHCYNAFFIQLHGAATMRKFSRTIPWLFALALWATSDVSLARGSHGGRVHYGGGKHTSSHGGHYAGGRGSSHRGGKYGNARSGNRYGTHK